MPDDSIHVFPALASDQVPQPVHAGHIALLGDAFHPHGGALAVGGSLAIDDSIALYLCLRQAQELGFATSASGGVSNVGLSYALDLYSATRLPQINKVCNAVVELRRHAAKPGRCWDEEKIQMWAKNKKEVIWLHEYNVHKAFAQASKDVPIAK